MRNLSDIIDETWVDEDMIQDCIENPVLSMHHNWVGSQKTAYDALAAKGRRLYDNLRTKHNVPHGEAFDAALKRFGLSKTLYL
jgi:hypothetical protein